MFYIRVLRFKFLYVFQAANLLLQCPSQQHHQPSTLLHQVYNMPHHHTLSQMSRLLLDHLACRQHHMSDHPCQFLSLLQGHQACSRDHQACSRAHRGCNKAHRASQLATQGFHQGIPCRTIQASPAISYLEWCNKDLNMAFLWCRDQGFHQWNTCKGWWAGLLCYHIGQLHDRNFSWLEDLLDEDQDHLCLVWLHWLEWECLIWVCDKVLHIRQEVLSQHLQVIYQ